MNKAKKILGYVWASPITAAGLAYSCVFWCLGWYKWAGIHGDGMVWQTKKEMPSWLVRLWKNWAGHAVGNVVVLNRDPAKDPTTLNHELVHVRQCMRLGALQPVIYAISSFGIWAGCETSNPYWSNPFEIDARRAVGQRVDVESAIAKLAGKSR